MEPRIAKQEAHAEHIRADMQDLRTDLRDLRTDMRDLRKTVDQHCYILLGGITGLAGLMAKGFHWL